MSQPYAACCIVLQFRRMSCIMLLGLVRAEICRYVETGVIKASVTSKYLTKHRGNGGGREIMASDTDGNVSMAMKIL